MLVVSYRIFGMVRQFHLQGSDSPIMKNWVAWSLKIWPIWRGETSVTNYQSLPRNISEDRRLKLHSGGTLKSGILLLLYNH